VTSHRKTALVTGVLFIVTFVSAIGGALLYGPVLTDPGYVIGSGADARVLLGALFEVVLIIANIGTAIALFPILKRQHEGLALSYVAARLMESMLIAVGILSLITVVTLRQQAPGADAGSLVTAAKALVAIHDWTFLLGPGFVVGIGNGLILGYLMYGSGLMPPRLALFGLVGGPLVCLSGIAVLFGIIDAGSAVQGIATLPEIIWEASLGLYLTFKGFRPSPLFSASAG
jgi:hypothetical protein